MYDRYVSFRGQDGNEAEEFIQAVRKAAFDVNKDRDDEWMARFASACMSGTALRWYESLDDDVQESWKRLKQAILVRYLPAKDAIVPSASAAPAAVAPPAPAPQPAARWPSSFPLVDFDPFAPAPSGSYTSKPSNKPFDGASGIIEIRYAETNQLMGYLSQKLRANGAAQRNKFIGMTWLHQESARAPAGNRDGSGSSINGHSYKGDSEAAIWDIASDGKVTARFGGRPLEFYIYDETSQINLFPDFNSYATSRVVVPHWVLVWDAIVPSASAAPAAPAPRPSSFPQVDFAPPTAAPHPSYAPKFAFAPAPPAVAQWPSSFPQADFAPPAPITLQNYTPRRAPAAAPPAAAQGPSSFSLADFDPFVPAPSGSYTSKRNSKPFDGASGIIEIRYAETDKLMGYLSQKLRDDGAAQLGNDIP
ncbi:hypothetical protein FRC05_002262 [Tulasnella sp. 425]|nr:hypothetical protein FRC05_002262 [Tulasnella sp. 425]